MDTATSPRYWVMLDCCYSGAGGMEALTSALAGIGTRTIWVIALGPAGQSSRPHCQVGSQGVIGTSAILVEGVGGGDEFGHRRLRREQQAVPARVLDHYDSSQIAAAESSAGFAPDRRGSTARPAG